MAIVTPEILAKLAPGGCLRVSINYGNPILATQDAAGQPQGISVDLARELAVALALPLEFLTFDAAGKAVAAVALGEADVGFFAVDPKRGEEIAFTAPYILIEGSYLVRVDSPIQTNSEVDNPGIRVAVGTGSAYDLYLTRELKQAEIVRGSTSPEVVNTFLREGLDVAAGVKPQLEADAQRLGGLRLLSENFMVIRQAMGIAKSRGPEAAGWLDDFIARMKRNGVVAAAMRGHGIQGASIAE